MNKEELLRLLFDKVVTGEISREEIASRLNIQTVVQSAITQESVKKLSSFSITKMLYVFGGAVVIIGIIIFIAQIWSDIGSLGRISVTLGLGFMITVIGSILLVNKPEDNIGTVFHCIGGLLIPGGALVALSELNIGQDSMWPEAITFGVIFTFYLFINFIHKNAILTFFTIANGTAFIYLIMESIIDGQYYMQGDIYAYLTMIVGVSYILFAQAFNNSWNKNLTGVLYFIGITGFLAAAFSQVFDSVIWQMLYFIIIIGCLSLSVFIKKRSILIMSTLFLIAHISYITSEYFADSIGWPISLVILGFIFIGLGYVAVSINKNYIIK